MISRLGSSRCSSCLYSARAQIFPSLRLLLLHLSLTCVSSDQKVSFSRIIRDLH
jgi:hypothetical protein